MDENIWKPRNPLGFPRESTASERDSRTPNSESRRSDTSERGHQWLVILHPTGPRLAVERNQEASHLWRIFFGSFWFSQPCRNHMSWVILVENSQDPRGHAVARRGTPHLWPHFVFAIARREENEPHVTLWRGSSMVKRMHIMFIYIYMCVCVYLYIDLWILYDIIIYIFWILYSAISMTSY
jgi:hypothetical protein